MKVLCALYGREVLVDDEDFDRLVGFTWYRAAGAYVARWENGAHLMLHHAVTGESSAVVVDHKDRNPFNNQRDDLRVANKSLNGANSKSRTQYAGRNRSSK